MLGHDDWPKEEMGDKCTEIDYDDRLLFCTLYERPNGMHVHVLRQASMHS